jgi:hypothetical protein
MHNDDSVGVIRGSAVETQEMVRVSIGSEIFGLGEGMIFDVSVNYS